MPFVLAGFLIAVSCSDALGFNEQSAEVGLENERAFESQFSGSNSYSFVHIAV